MTRKLKNRNSQQRNYQNQDHFQKPKSNSERIDNLEYHLNQIYRIMGEMNTRLIAVCQAKVTPEVMAKFIMDEAAQDAYMKNINLAIDAEIEKKKEAAKPKVSDDTKAAIDKAKL